MQTKPNMQTPPIFDGHNDVLTRIFRSGADPVANVQSCDGGHIDIARARNGGLGGGFFAVWIPSPINLSDLTDEMVKDTYNLPLPEPIAREYALDVAMTEISYLHKCDAAGLLHVCTTAAELETAIQTGEFAAILHLEGAEPIDDDLTTLDVLYRAGLRSLGPVWSRNTIFAEGVPFAFPANPDFGGGLTDAGKRLVMRCNELGVMLDLSHLNLAGFWDVAKLSDSPLVATHSNAHALCTHARNLTDEQLAAIRKSAGMVGLNFAAAFLREDGKMDEDVPMETVLAHLDHLIEHLGEDGVGLGSDFDGAVVPKAIGDAAGLPVLRQAMVDHGYDEARIEKLCWKNWVDVLRRTWGA